MKALHLVAFLLVTASLFVFVGCNKNDEALCQGVCKKGIVLAKADLTQTMKAADQAVMTDALAEWSKQETLLNALIPSCVERCVREPNGAVAPCLDRAKSLQSFLACLK